jgi:hypothetical protein
MAIAGILRRFLKNDCLAKTTKTAIELLTLAYYQALISLNTVEERGFCDCVKNNTPQKTCENGKACQIPFIKQAKR